MINLRKKIHHNIILALLLLFSSQIVWANPNNPITKVQYQMMFKAHEIMCSAKLNSAYLFNTETVQKGVPQLISLIDSIGIYMDEGKNILTLDGVNLSNYIDDPSGAYCEIDIVAMVQNPESGEIETKKVSNIRYTYKRATEDSHSPYPYVLSVEESNFNLDPNLTSEKIEIKELPFLTDDDGEKVQNIQVSRDIYVHHQQPFRWIHESIPFTDTPENRQKLWEKYNEIRAAIINKDKKIIRQLVDFGANDVAKFDNVDVEEHFEIIFDQILDEFFNINSDIWISEPLTEDKYDLELYAGGKLFRFNQKGMNISSPLRWKNAYGKNVLRYNPIFTCIDGKIEVALF